MNRNALWRCFSALPALITAGFLAYALYLSGWHPGVVMAIPLGLACLYSDLGVSLPVSAVLALLSYTFYAALAFAATIAPSLPVKLLLCVGLVAIALTNLHGCRKLAGPFTHVTRRATQMRAASAWECTTDV
jgi:hypothetical protein